MGRKKQKLLSLVALMCFLYFSTFLSQCSTNTKQYSNPIESYTLNPTASTDPGSPEYLGDYALYETYSLIQQSYYYYTDDVEGDDYYLIWLWEVEHDDDFDLHLYSDNLFSSSSLITSSDSGIEDLEWIVYRPSVDGPLYIRTHTWFGTGNAYIKYDTASSVVSSADWTEVEFTHVYDFLHIYEIPFVAGVSYTINLDIQSQSDFSLYVFRMTPDGTTQLDWHCSTNSGLGTDESITFTPQTTDFYAIVIERESELGRAVLSITNNQIIPSFELVAVLLAFTLILFMFFVAPRLKSQLINLKERGMKNE